MAKLKKEEMRLVQLSTNHLNVVKPIVDFDVIIKA
jgi:hypothetical protein